MRPKGPIFGLLLASGTVIFAAAGQAAELPTMRVAPPQHSRTCHVGGMEGVVIPGSSACVKVSGYISVGATAGDLKQPYGSTPPK
jgi:hypothetical protein